MDEKEVLIKKLEELRHEKLEKQAALEELQIKYNNKYETKDKEKEIGE